MKIGLIDVDSRNFPNLALMKISAYYKAHNHSVEWWNGFANYDIVHMSKVFTNEYSPDAFTPCNADLVIHGGTGYDLKNKLQPEIENSYPDYSLYPNFDEAYGFLTRGCPRACQFCIVAQKEGRISHQVSNLDAFYQNQKQIKLLDPNLLACKNHEKLLEQLAQSGAWVDFTQGLDVRLITKDSITLLNKVKTKLIHFAWDNPKDDLTEYFDRFKKHTTIQDHRKLSVYVLTNFGSTHEEDLYRIYTLRKLGFNPYVMIYEKSTAPRKTRLLQRWCNNRIIFNTQPDFRKYNPKLG